MSSILLFMLYGLGIGGFYALLASGIVVAFKGSGVINFGHAAVAMYTAFQFYYLRRKGLFRLPWFNIVPSKQLGFRLPVTLRLVHGPMAFVPALALSLLTAAGLGLLMHVLVFRPLRSAAPLGKVVGSLGVMLYLQGVALLNFGTENPQPATVLPKGRWANFAGLGRPMPKENVYVSVAAVVLGAVLWFIYKKTRFGLATRAAAGNEKGAVLLGYSPDRLALTNWVIAATTAGLAGIVVGPVTGSLSQTKFTLLIVPALGAALIGSLSSIPVAVVGGIALGMLETFSTSWLRARSWFPDWASSGVKDALPLVAIVAVLFLRGRALPIRGTIEQRRFPLSPRPVRVGWHALIWPAVATALAFDFTGRWSFALTTSLISAMLMLSFVVLTGYVGQISLAQLSLAGVAAFFLARMEANGGHTALNPFTVSGPGLPWPIAVALAVALAVAVGLVLGLPALRIRGVQLAVVTIAAALAIQTLYLENVKLSGLRAGANGVVNSPTLFGLDIGASGKGGLTDRPSFAVFSAIVLALLCVLVSNLRRGTTGRRFLAVRANERAAAASGINVARTKLLASGIASALAGIAGVMFAFQQQQVSSANWTFFLGLGFLAFAYLGGITSVNGAILGGVLAPAGLAVVFGNLHFHGIASYTSVLGGIGLILTAILYPGGQALAFQPMIRHAGSWLRTARGREWAAAARTYGPTIAAGAVIGALIWPLRNHRFQARWMVPLGAVLALMVRSTGLQIYRAVLHRRPSEDSAELTPSLEVASGAVAVPPRPTAGALR